MPTHRQIQQGLFTSIAVIYAFYSRMDLEEHPLAAAHLFGLMLLMAGMMLENHRMVSLLEDVPHNRANVIREANSDIASRIRSGLMAPALPFVMIKFFDIEARIAIPVFIILVGMSLIGIRNDQELIKIAEHTDAQPAQQPHP